MTDNRRDEFHYQLLSRLQQDCEYYLGFGARNKKHLWAQDEAEQIQKMKDLYAELPEKPEWITLADIEKYEAEMVSSVDATLAEDWLVTDVSRKPAGYSAKTKDGDVQLELISFKVSFQGGAPEQLTDVPFSCGITTAELAQWCSTDTVAARRQEN